MGSSFSDFGRYELTALISKRLFEQVKNSTKISALQVVSSHGGSLGNLTSHEHVLLNSVKSSHVLDITELLGAELELRKTKELLRYLIDASPDFICYKDAESRWQEANSSSLELFQLNSQDYQNKTDNELANLVNPIFKEAFRHSKTTDERTWRSGKTFRNEETVALPQGGEKILDVIKVPLFNEDGSRRGLVTLGRDITERKMAENHLRDRSAVLDALISCDWLLHSAESWHTVAATVLQQMCLALRFTRATIVRNIAAKNSESKVSGESRTSNEPARSKILYKWSMPGFINPGSHLESINFNDENLKRWHDALQQGNPVFGDIKDLPSDERKILKQHDTQSIVIVPLFSESAWWGNIIIERCHDLIKTTPQELGSLMAIGRSLGVAIHRECTGKRLNQAKIAFDSATEGIMIIDANTHIIAINKGFADITGFTEEEVLGSTPKALQEENHDIRRDLLSNGKWCGEVTNTRKNGETYQEWLTITIVKNLEGNIVNYVGVFADITESKRSQHRLHELVNHDALTGLPNRRLLNELLELAIKRAERENHQIALLFIDLDRFKSINDSLGHQVGDKLLYEVSRRISHAMRESDVVARLGGDEFLVMMDKISNPDDAEQIARKIVHTLQAEFNIDGKEIFISASIGISIFPNDGDDVDSTIKAADIAMYQVKNKGKNNHCFYSAELSKNVLERFTMENQLRRALERNQFEVYYQPQISLVTGDIIGAEALIRWNHPELGLVSPAKFIPVAEETGLIVQIGEWVLRQAALQAMQWLNDGYAMQWISVNVSGVQVMRGSFADTVYGILIETDCRPDMLELEITESTVMQNTEFVIDTFDSIRKLGVRLAIDDFGTGYSSLSILKRLPLDKIKIDQSFVRGLPHDVDDAAIANAIYAMASSLGFAVIAEGVETLAQAEFLKNMNCKEAQGYLYSKPITTAEFTKLLATSKQRGHENAK